jgi:hypothetical protein
VNRDNPEKMICWKTEKGNEGGRDFDEDKNYKLVYSSISLSFSQNISESLVK